RKTSTAMPTDMPLSSLEMRGLKEQGDAVARCLRPRGLPKTGTARRAWMWSSEACSFLCYTGGTLSRADPLTDVQEDHTEPSQSRAQKSTRTYRPGFPMLLACFGCYCTIAYFD